MRNIPFGKLLWCALLAYSVSCMTGAAFAQGRQISGGTSGYNTAGRNARPMFKIDRLLYTGQDFKVYTQRPAPFSTYCGDGVARFSVLYAVGPGGRISREKVYSDLYSGLMQRLVGDACAGAKSIATDHYIDGVFLTGTGDIVSEDVARSNPNTSNEPLNWANLEAPFATRQIDAMWFGGHGRRPPNGSPFLKAFYEQVSRVSGMKESNFNGYFPADTSRQIDFIKTDGDKPFERYSNQQYLHYFTHMKYYSDMCLATYAGKFVQKRKKLRTLENSITTYSYAGGGWIIANTTDYYRTEIVDFIRLKPEWILLYDSTNTVFEKKYLENLMPNIAISGVWGASSAFDGIKEIALAQQAAIKSMGCETPAIRSFQAKLYAMMAQVNRLAQGH